VDGGSANVPSTDALFGTNDSVVSEPWGNWTQNPEDVELRFALEDASVASKQVSVKFGRTSLKVAVSGVPVLEGKLFDAVHVDDCTFTLQTTREGVRELCVTLAKAQEGRTWSWAVQ
jgi:hypothetical protein